MGLLLFPFLDFCRFCRSVIRNPSNMTKNNILPEYSRRIKGLRKALGQKQEELAFVIDGEQPSVSQWERGRIRNPEMIAEKIQAWSEYLANPHGFSDKAEQYGSRKSKKPLAPDPSSPLIFGREQAGVMALKILDAVMTPAEWDEMLSSQIWTASKAPGSRSEILAELGSGALRAPTSEAVAKDIQVHGLAFVQRAQAFWTIPDEVHEACWKIRGYAREAAHSLLVDLAESRESKGFRKLESSAFLKRAPSELPPGMKGQSVDRTISEQFAEMDENFWPAMDFLARLLTLASTDSGDIDQEMMGAVKARVQTYVRQRDEANASP